MPTKILLVGVESPVEHRRIVYKDNVHDALLFLGENTRLTSCVFVNPSVPFWEESDGPGIEEFVTFLGRPLNKIPQKRLPWLLVSGTVDASLEQFPRIEKEGMELFLKAFLEKSPT